MSFDSDRIGKLFSELFAGPAPRSRSRAQRLEILRQLSVAELTAIVLRLTEICPGAPEEVTALVEENKGALRWLTVREGYFRNSADDLSMFTDEHLYDDGCGGQDIRSPTESKLWGMVSALEGCGDWYLASAAYDGIARALFDYEPRIERQFEIVGGRLITGLVRCVSDVSAREWPEAIRLFLFQDLLRLWHCRLLSEADASAALSEFPTKSERKRLRGLLTGCAADRGEHVEDGLFRDLPEFLRPG